jgi:hypothetical protein
MSITVPTASSLKLRFKEFAGQTDTDIEFAIEEAMLHVDDSWPTDRASLAILYLAAHYLMVTISRAQSGTGQRIKSQTMDGMSFTYVDDTAKKPDPADFSTTPYGSRYLDLVNMNFPGVLLI